MGTHTAGEGAGASEEGGTLTYALQVAAQEVLRLAGGVKMEGGSPEAEAEEEAVVHALRALDPADSRSRRAALSLVWAQTRMR